MFVVALLLQRDDHLDGVGFQPIQVLQDGVDLDQAVMVGVARLGRGGFLLSARRGRPSWSGQPPLGCGRLLAGTDSGMPFVVGASYFHTLAWMPPGSHLIEVGPGVYRVEVTGAGIEPAARALKVRCSTTELPGLGANTENAEWHRRPDGLHDNCCRNAHTAHQ